MTRQRFIAALGAATIAAALFAAIAQAASAAPADDGSDYAYRAAAGDTLIGIGRRLLKDPAKWRALQMRNAVKLPTRIPVGTLLRIPRDWLKQEAESATALSVVGSAGRDGTRLQAGEALPEGTRVTTAAGSHLTVKLADGSVLTLNPQGALTLERLTRYPGTGRRDTLLKLETGSVETKVKPQGEAGRFQIRTPVAVSAVRGTEFRRSVDAAALDRTEVVDGSVAVARAPSAGAAADGVEVPAGFGTLSDTDGPRPPVKLLPPPDLSGLPGDWQDEMLSVAFAAVADARSYRAQIAADADFHEVLAESEAAGPPLQFAALPDGGYWLRVRSVDAQGLAGADAVRPLRRHRLPGTPVPQAPAADGFTSGADVAFRWGGIDASAGYRLQLSRDAGFGSHHGEHVGAEPQWRQSGVAPGVYYWRVAAINAAGESGRWSETRRFTHKPPAALITQAALSGKSLQLSWSGRPDQRFRLQLAHDAAFERIAADLATAEPQARLPGLGAGGYYARVQATDADGYVGPWSDARRIQVPLPWWVKASPLLLILPFL